MTVATIALVAAVVTTVALLVAVVALHRRLRALSAEVDRLHGPTEMRSASSATAAAVPVSRPERQPAPASDAPPPAPERPVPVITGLRTEGDDGAEAVPTAGRVVSVTLAGPMIKVAALSHGIRRALREEYRMQVAFAFRKELRRQRKLRRRTASTRPPQKEGWRP